jgi:DNA-binding transcriptional ArsR family regulator
MPGPGEILELVRSGRAVTRGDILEVTGLSRMTVSARIDSLRDAGLVVENGTDRVTGGRPSRRLEFNTARATLVVATVDTTTVALQPVLDERWPLTDPDIGTVHRLRYALSDSRVRQAELLVGEIVTQKPVWRMPIKALHVAGLAIRRSWRDRRTVRQRTARR